VTRIDWSFLKYVLSVLLGSIVLGLYPLGAYGTREVLAAAAVGAALTTANIFAGFITIEYTIEKSMTTFLRVVVGGLGIRLFVLLAAMAVCIRMLGFDVAALTISMFYFYAAYLILEVMYIQKRVRHRSLRNAETSG